MELNYLSVESVVKSARDAPTALNPPGDEESKIILSFNEALDLANKTVKDIMDASGKGKIINIYA